MTEGTEINGFVAPGFEPVRDAFAANFAAGMELGAAVAMYQDGLPVVDLWAGVADQETGRPWAEDTLVLVYSTTKGATAACANLLAQRGLLDVDAPVTEPWPEFGQAGKAEIPVRWLLGHKAGLAAVDADLTLQQALAWEPMVRALEAQAPLWEPGTAHGYHATTFGWLVGEVVRRADPGHRSLGTFFAEEIAGPLGLDWYIGLPPALEDRVAALPGALVPDEARTDPELMELINAFMGPDTMLGRALGAPSDVWAEPGVWNRPAVHQAEIPAANGITDARSVARFYAGLVADLPAAADGSRPAAKAVLEPDQIEAARTVQTDGTDLVLMGESKFGLGYLVASEFSPYGGARAFGHAGAGGSLGFTDPENGLAFGYVMNKMNLNLSGDPRTQALTEAMYRAAGVPTTHL